MKNHDTLLQWLYKSSYLIIKLNEKVHHARRKYDKFLEEELYTCVLTDSYYKHF